MGNISFYDSTGQSDYGLTKPFSEKTAETIDREVRRMVEEAYAKAKELLLSHRDQLDQLATQLYEKEVLFREDLERIYGPRPWEQEEQTSALPEQTDSTEPTEASQSSESTETAEPQADTDKNQDFEEL